MFTFSQTARHRALSGILFSIALGSISWTESYVHCASLTYETYQADQQPVNRDTVPGKSLDSQLRELRKAQEKLQREISGKNWDKIEAEMENALGRLNTAEIDEQVRKAMAQLDQQMEKLDEEKLLQKIDMEHLEQQMARAQEEVQREMSKRDWDKEIREALAASQKAMKDWKNNGTADLKAEMDRVRKQMDKESFRLKAELDQARINLKDQKSVIRKSLQEAENGLKDARIELEGYKTMTDDMISSGLIKDRRNYRVRYDTGTLTIDGVEQPENIVSKYKKYFRHPHTLILNENDRFEVDTDNVD
ncbi:hypothetical protein [Flavihumibacter petaseus]|uniref:Uncharacterized protein n=1 Tax=Flavihumibacter petaseus NBRC 106054 TaxID=1220578 RepID=A0A0E9N4N4_9BACT|nr:hypothetical protein [Flavihumibacter petaseus]GAO44907.1 hypothetical protein FPE01S_04_01500 [Flavihumibacter petaseus NBRC 106054]